MSPLAGYALRYEINNETATPEDGCITEAGFGSPPSKQGISIAYGNNLCQHEDRSLCGPFLDRQGTAREYSEDVPNPRMLGFEKNLTLQFELSRSQGHTFIELDNPDDEHFSIDDVLRGVELASKFGLGCIAKNPGLLPDCIKYVSHPNIFGIIVEKGAGTADDLHDIRVRSGKPDLPVWFVYFGNGRAQALKRKAEIEAKQFKNMSVTYDAAAQEYGGKIEHILRPITAGPQPQPNPNPPMSYSLTWLPDVLRAAGLKVQETPGWQTRGHGDIGKIQGVLCHHTNGARTGNMPTLPVLIDGRPDLAGPLSQIGLGRDGTFYIVCAGKGWHAGSGGWKGISDGNNHLIGIEAENVGDHTDPWPDVQMDAYRRGVAAILQHVGATSDYAIGHKEWTPRKDDPTFDMNQFRSDVAKLMSGGNVETLPDTPANLPVIGRGDTGAAVGKAQKLLGVTVDEDFGPDTDAATRAFQAARGLTVDGIIGPDTWRPLLSGAPPVEPAAGTLSQDTINKILAAARASSISRYSWQHGQGVAPIGYTCGMAVAFGKIYNDFKAGKSSALAMAKPLGDGEDVLVYYGLNPATPLDRLLATLTVQMGLGMLESSGNCYAGLDITTTNTNGETTEAGAFQQSWNSRSFSPELPKLFTEWRANTSDGFLSIWRQGLSGSPSTSYGSGDALAFQNLCKTKPQFAVEACAIGLRVTGGASGHWGPIRRKEAEVRPEATALFRQVIAIVDAAPVVVIPPIVVPPVVVPPVVIPPVNPPGPVKSPVEAAIDDLQATVTATQAKLDKLKEQIAMANQSSPDHLPFSIPDIPDGLVRWAWPFIQRLSAEQIIALKRKLLSGQFTLMDLLQIAMGGGQMFLSAPTTIDVMPNAPTPQQPTPSSGPNIGFWPGLITVVGSVIAGLNGVDISTAASVGAAGVGVAGGAALGATPPNYAALLQSIAQSLSRK